jgi:hypothetical protein
MEHDDDVSFSSPPSTPISMSQLPPLPASQPLASSTQNSSISTIEELSLNRFKTQWSFQARCIFKSCLKENCVGKFSFSIDFIDKTGKIRLIGSTEFLNIYDQILVGLNYTVSNGEINPFTLIQFGDSRIDLEIKMIPKVTVIVNIESKDEDFPNVEFKFLDIKSIQAHPVSFFFDEILLK